MIRYILIFLVYSSFFVQAQNPEKFQKVYTRTYLETSQKDFEKALEVADSLYQTSETPLFKVKSLMLTASLYQHSGDLKSAIENALRAEKITQLTSDYVWITRVYGFLATQYRLSGLYSQSEKYSDLAFAFGEKIQEKELSHSTLGMLLQEKAYNELNQKNYRKAIVHLKSAEQYFKKIQENRDYLIAQNEQLLGASYFRLNQSDSALWYYYQALASYGNNPENYIKGLIHNGISSIYLQSGRLDSAAYHLDKASKIAETSNYLELKSEVNKTSKQYFMAVEDLEGLSQTTLKQDSIADQIAKKKASFLNESFKEINEKNTLILKNISNKNKMLIGILTLSLLGLIYFIFYRRNQRKQMDKIREIIRKLEEEEQQPKEKEPKEEETQSIELSSNEKEIKPLPINEDSPSIMTQTTEEKLLKKLENFEASELYTQNSISLSYLATYCKTNSKYLSYVINTHKKQDFNNYINELRVNYIIRKLKNDPMYRKYKIATLAEEAGFSSQNKFSTVFKKVTSISPSIFIQYLESEKEDKELVRK